MLNAPPKPVSASTSSGSVHAAVIRRTSSVTSFKVVTPRSGRPKALLATPAPDRYRARKPARAASIAAYALTAPTICSGWSSSSAARRDWSADRFDICGLPSLPLQPGNQTLGVEVEVFGQVFIHAHLWFGKPVPARQLNPQGAHVRVDARVWRGGGGMPQGDGHQLPNLRLERCGDGRQTGHPTVMHQVGGLRAGCHEPIDRSNELLRIELRRRGRGHSEGSLRGIQFPIGKAEGIAGEQIAMLQIHHTIMMQGVTRGMQQLHWPILKRQQRPVLAGDDATRLDGDQIPVQLAVEFL